MFIESLFAHVLTRLAFLKLPIAGRCNSLATPITIKLGNKQFTNNPEDSLLKASKPACPLDSFVSITVLGTIAVDKSKAVTLSMGYFSHICTPEISKSLTPSNAGFLR